MMSWSCVNQNGECVYQVRVVQNGLSVLTRIMIHTPHFDLHTRIMIQACTPFMYTPTYNTHTQRFTNGGPIVLFYIEYGIGRWCVDYETHTHQPQE